MWEVEGKGWWGVVVRRRCRLEWLEILILFWDLFALGLYFRGTLN